MRGQPAHRSRRTAATRSADASDRRATALPGRTGSICAMTASHATAADPTASTGSSARQISVLLYSDDRTTRDAVRRHRGTTSGARRRGGVVA